MDVSIIIINYKTFLLTQQCIDSILHHTKGVTFEIILVENGTDEFNQENTARWGNKVNLIESKDNLGFAGGNNLGIKFAKGKYILLLNSDTYLTEDSVSKSFHFMQEQPGVGALTARLIYPDGRPQSVAQRFPSIKYSLIELLRIQKLLSRRKAGKMLLGSFFEHNETTEADWIWGAFFMMKSEIIPKLPNGKLDDSYFMYWEDVQWCMDIKKLGYRVFFFADTTVVHIQEGSSGKKNDMMEKNKVVFFKKNYSYFETGIIKILNKCLGV